MTDTPAAPLSPDAKAYAATPAAELERQIMYSGEPKNEREWWAAREIERLRRALAEQDTAARDAAMAAAVSAVCEHCRNGVPLVPVGDRMQHKVPFHSGGTAWIYSSCPAADIRALSVTPPEAASEKENERG